MITLFISQQGVVTCGHHGGMYLEFSLRENPSLTNIDTPLDNWQRLTPAEVEKFDLQCESAQFSGRTDCKDIS